LVVMLAILSIPSLFAASLDSGTAQKWVHRQLKANLATRLIEDMKAAGLQAPDRDMAERWDREFKQFERMEFVSVEVKHFIFVPTLITSSRMFVAKAVLRPENGKEVTRYFSLSAQNNFFDFFWVAEQSRWMWWFSI